MTSRLGKLALIATILLGLSIWAQAAEIKVLSAAGMSAILDELGPEFERTTGHKLLIQFELAAVIPRKISAGEVFDVAITTIDGINGQIWAGRIDANPRADFAHAGMGVAMRAGAAKRDVSSIDAFRRALLNADLSLTPQGPLELILRACYSASGSLKKSKQRRCFGMEEFPSPRRSPMVMLN